MRVHIKKMKNYNQNIVYLPDSLKFFVANSYTSKVIEKIVSGVSFDKLEFDGLEKEKYDAISAVLSEKLPLEQDEVPENVLPRLVMNTSNRCNLGCKYCYANGGNYDSNESIMTKETALNALDKMFTIYDNIEFIQLFGGEPCLNIELIEVVCEYIIRKGKKTQVSMVTNGTIMPDRLIELIEKYNILVTLSLDHEKIHDELRPYKNFTNSYENILNNMKKLREKSNQPSQVEVTYTKLHDEKGISVYDVIDSVTNQLGEIPIHLVPVVTDNTSLRLTDVSPFIDSICDFFTGRKEAEDKAAYSYIERFLGPLLDKKIDSIYCGAGVNTLSVSNDGSIFPCFYFTDNEEYKIASVDDSDEDIRNILKQSRKRYLNQSKKLNGKCKDCFANTVCYNCIGANLSDTGNLYETSEFNCKLTCDGLEMVLEELVKDHLIKKNNK